MKKNTKMDIKCSKCKIVFKFYWLKDGICNGCRNPHLIVKAIV
jgi:hypothetical protein